MVRLWHLDVSHFSEKARWALDYKRVPHVRRAVPPGPHMALAFGLTRRSTLPIVTFDGDAVRDSGVIIDELERRFPDPRLYPSDPDERALAVALESALDEELGPQIRAVLLIHVLNDNGLALLASAPDAPRWRRALLRPAVPAVVRTLAVRYPINPETAAEGMARTRAMLDRIADGIGPKGYLVGDSFSVADLTAAALCFPLAPERFLRPVHFATRQLIELREELADHPAIAYVEEMYERHRGPAPQTRAQGASPVSATYA